MAIRPADHRRLARLAAPRFYEERWAVERRVARRRSVEFLAMVCELLAGEGVDPETTCVPGQLRDAVASLTAIPDSPKLRRADAKYLAQSDPGWIERWRPRGRYQAPPREEMSFAAEVERLIGRFRGNGDIDVAIASPIDLFAWCLSRHGASITEAAENLLHPSDPPSDKSAPAAVITSDLIELSQ